METVSNEESNIASILMDRFRVQGIDEEEFLNKRLNQLKPEKKAVPGSTTLSSIKEMLRELTIYKELDDNQKTRIEELPLTQTVRELISIFITRVK